MEGRPRVTFWSIGECCIGFKAWALGLLAQNEVRKHCPYLKTIETVEMKRKIFQNKTLWVTLAAISLKYDQLEISEEAYCASLQVDKVEYLQHIKV